MKNKLLFILALPSALCQSMNQDRKRPVSPGGETRGTKVCISHAATSSTTDTAIRNYLEMFPTDNRRANRAGRTALHHAAAQGNVAEIERLLDAGADVNKSTGDADNYAPLMLAAKKGHIAAAKLLIERGATVNRRIGPNEYGLYTAEALHWAVIKKHQEMTQFLLENGADPDLHFGDGMETALVVAVSGDDLPMVQLLLDHGANINLGAGSAQTPLHHAAATGSVAIARLLITRGARLNEADGTPAEHTPLQEALYDQNDDVALLLIDAGAAVNTVIPGKFGALKQAIRDDNHVLAAKLIEHGANIHAHNALGATLLHEAARNDALQCTALLIARGAQVNARARRGITPLDVAICCRNWDLASILVDNGGKKREEQEVAIAIEIDQNTIAGKSEEKAIVNGLRQDDLE